ncbi:45906_t:CDS:2, partial [Gigaspora margarita]
MEHEVAVENQQVKLEANNFCEESSTASGRRFWQLNKQTIREKALEPDQEIVKERIENLYNNRIQDFNAQEVVVIEQDVQMIGVEFLPEIAKQTLISSGIENIIQPKVNNSFTKI